MQRTEMVELRKFWYSMQCEWWNQTKWRRGL